MTVSGALRIAFPALWIGLFLAELSVAGDPLDNWQQRQPPRSGFWRRIRSANGCFLVPGYYTNRIFCSTDGIHWNASHPLTRNWPLLRDVAWGNGTYLAVGSEQGAVYTSVDRQDWTYRSTGLMADLMAIAFGSGKFVAVGGGGVVCLSTNGIDWSQSAQLPTTYLYCIAYGDGRFVAGGYNGAIFSSSDGVLWAARTSGRIERLESITHGGGVFVIAGSFPSDVLLTSSNSMNWTVSYQNGAAQSLFDVTFGEGVFVAGAAVMVSTNGLDWEVRAPASTASMSGIAYGQRTFVGLNGSGSIIQSDALNSLALRAGDIPELEVFGLRGRTYRVECADRLNTAEPWFAAGWVTVTNSPQRWRDTNASTSLLRLYRTVWQP